MNDIELKAKKISYAFLLKHGEFTTGEWSYYGSHFELLLPEDVPSYGTSCKQIEDFHASIEKEIKEVGVDWVNTKMPKTESHSEFNGTFADSTYRECTIGEIVLKNGKSYKIGADTALPFAAHVRDILSIMKMVEETDSIFED